MDLIDNVLPNINLEKSKNKPKKKDSKKATKLTTVYQKRPKWFAIFLNEYEAMGQLRNTISSLPTHLKKLISEKKKHSNEAIEAILEILKTFFDYPLFYENDYLSKMFTEIIENMIDVDQDSENNIQNLLIGSYEFLLKLTDVIFDFDIICLLIFVLESITKKIENNQYISKLGTICGECLKKSWGENLYKPSHVSNLLRLHVSYCDLSVIMDLIDNVLPNINLEKSKNKPKKKDSKKKSKKHKESKDSEESSGEKKSKKSKKSKKHKKSKSKDKSNNSDEERSGEKKI